jgi:hypothetical protein
MQTNKSASLNAAMNTPSSLQDSIEELQDALACCNCSSGSPLATTLHEVLSQIANSFSSEDAVIMCNAVANSLAAVMVRNAPAAQASLQQPQQRVDNGMLQYVHQELERQQQYQDLQRQHAQLDYELEMLQAQQNLQRRRMQQELHRQHAQVPAQSVSTGMLDAAYAIATHAAQEAAASWNLQHQQARSTLQQEASGWHGGGGAYAASTQGSLPWHQPHDQAFFQSSREGRHPQVPDRLSHSYGFEGLPLPPHLPSSLASSQMYGTRQQTRSFNGVPPAERHNEANTPSTTQSLPEVSAGKGGGRGNRGKGSAHIKEVSNQRGTAAGARGEQRAEQGAANCMGNESNKRSVSAANKYQQELAAVNNSNKSLRDHLEGLHGTDSQRVVLVRKINRLRFESAQILEEHFTRYGEVETVLVSHSHAKSRKPRVRPSGLGFVVMKTAEGAQAVLADGPELKIQAAPDENAVTINVQSFEEDAKPNMEDMCDNEA